MSINIEVIFRESSLMFRVTGVNKDVAKDKHYIPTHTHTQRALLMNIQTLSQTVHVPQTLISV